MALSLSEFLLRDFSVEQADALRIDLGRRNRLRLPAIKRAYCHLVLSGSLKLSVDETGETIELQPGDFAMLIYGAAHTLSGLDARRNSSTQVLDDWPAADVPALITCGADSQASILSSACRLARPLPTGKLMQPLPHLLRYSLDASADRAGPALCTDLQQIRAACGGPGASAFVQALVQLHLTQALRNVHEQAQQVFPMHIGSAETRRMATVARRIVEHPEKPWTVALLAREVGCSRSSFAAKFRAHAGLGPIRFVTETRLAQAVSLLKGNPDLPLWDVARRVGYSSQSSFTRAFKQQFGISPRHYAVGQA